MANKIQHFRIRFVADAGSAYGTDMNTGEEVFINSSITDAMGIQMGDLVKAAVIPNNKSEEVEWYALIAELVEED